MRGLMETVNIILSTLSLLAFLIIGWFVKSYFPTYLQKKAENLATKEDIGHLTDAVESIKAKYATDLEVLRAELVKSNQVQQIQFKTEFDTYVEIMAKIVRLQSATLSLRPALDYTPKDEAAQKAERIRRLEAYGKAYEPFWLNVHEKRPFYSPAIWEKLRDLMRLVRWEASQYSDGQESAKNMEYWDKADKNQEKILSLIEEVVESIRSRFDDLKAVK
jgi:hypothetical protein